MGFGISSITKAITSPLKIVKKAITKKVTSKGEEAAVYDIEKNKSNKYASVNRHLISKLKG